MKSTFELTVNDVRKEISADPDMPLLWALRELLNLTGTKYGCGIGQCGACMVHLDGDAVPACTTPISEIGNRAISTIEGMSSDTFSALRQAWIELEVPQCGFCQPGQLMAAHALLMRNSNPSDADINGAMSPVLCRCGTYQRVRAAIHRTAKHMQEIEY